MVEEIGNEEGLMELWLALLDRLETYMVAVLRAELILHLIWGFFGDLSLDLSSHWEGILHHHFV